MYIAKLSENYVEDMHSIEKESFPDPWSRYSILTEFKQAVFLGAFDESGLMGYIALRDEIDEGYISNIAVAKKHRRKGVGEALLYAVKKFAAKKKYTRISLEVRAGNLAAIALYEKAGFNAVALAWEYYTNPVENGVVMEILL